MWASCGPGAPKRGILAQNTSDKVCLLGMREMGETLAKLVLMGLFSY